MIDRRADGPQSWPLPSHARPIVIIGAGAIVRTAHLPAYARLGFPVAGVFDIAPDRARAAARQASVRTVYGSVAEAGAVRDAVFDVAVPGDQTLGVLGCLPRRAAVLVQKPVGLDLDGARQILTVCRERELVAAVNFQLRFSPNMIALRDLVERGAIGELTDVEVRVVDRQPWEQWSFLKGTPRLEVLYHSIHYLDAIRSIAGEPNGVWCRAVRHPALRELADTRSTTILDFGGRIRCSLTLNHTHRYNTTHRASLFKVEGTDGAALLTMGVNIDYPTGPPDTMEVALAGADWRPVPLRGSWFTEAFEGPMSNLQRFIAGEDKALVSPVDDAIKTMALVEACYRSSERGATSIPRVAP